MRQRGSGSGGREGRLREGNNSLLHTVRTLQVSRLERNERGRDDTRHGRSEGKKGGTKRAEE